MKKQLSILFLLAVISNLIVAQTAPVAETNTGAPITNTTAVTPSGVHPIVNYNSRPQKASQILVSDTNRHHYFHAPARIYKCDSIGNPTPNNDRVYTNVNIKDGFEIIGLNYDSTAYIIEYWPEPHSIGNRDERMKTFHPHLYKIENDAVQTNQQGQSGGKEKKPKHPKLENATNQDYFLLMKSDFDGATKVYVESKKCVFSYGTIIYPVKFHPQYGTFTTNANMGIVAGPNWILSKNSTFGVFGGVSITQASIDSASTHGAIKGSSQRAVFSPTLNLVATIGKLNIALGLGLDVIDLAGGAAERSWIYNNKPYFCFGLGLNLFGTTSNTTAPSLPQTPPKNN